MDMEESELLPLFIRIGELLHRYRHVAYHRRGPGADPHRGQGRVMTLLKMRPEISQKDLSYLLDIRPQSLGELLAKLERGGYIERTPSESDRRVMNIKLTESGAAAAEEQSESHCGDDMFASLNPEDRETLRDYLTRVIGDLEKALDAMRDGGHDHDDHCGPHGHEHDPRHGRCPGDFRGRPGCGRHGRERPHDHDHEPGRGRRPF